MLVFSYLIQRPEFNDMSDVLPDEPELKDLLSGQDLERIALPPAVSQFQRSKLEKEAKKNWDLFYKRNGNRFFKRRHWTRREFPELLENSHDSDSSLLASSKRYLLEVGCGCGDFILPLLDDTSTLQNTPREDEAGETNPNQGTLPISLPRDLVVFCCDLSDKAIEILKENPIYKVAYPARVKAFQADITADCSKIFEEMGEDIQGVDFISLIFVLSAMEPDLMSRVVSNLHKLLKPGGLVLFRDYAIYDKAMLRFDAKSKIDHGLYVRQDGTRAYFFSKNYLSHLFLSKNLFSCKSIEYVHRETVNNATNAQYSRIFLQAKFVRL